MGRGIGHIWVLQGASGPPVVWVDSIVDSWRKLGTVAYMQAILGNKNAAAATATLGIVGQTSGVDEWCTCCQWYQYEQHPQRDP